MMNARFSMRNAFRAYVRYYCEGVSQTHVSGTSTTSAKTTVSPDVPGLSSAVVHSADKPVGPGVDPNKSGAYKVPEYFCYDNISYFEAEVEMAKYRLPQPSALQK